MLTGRWVEEHSLGNEHEPESGPMAACLEASATYLVPSCGSPRLAATPCWVGRYLFSVVEDAVGEEGCGAVGKPARRWAASGEVCCGKPGEGPASGCRREGAENDWGGLRKFSPEPRATVLKCGPPGAAQKMGGPKNL